jgi:hypothetical protein
MNAEAKTYWYRPIFVHPPGSGGGVIIGSRGTRETVDTGERRAYTHYTARHLITTTKTVQPPSVVTEDGWFVELPDASCQQVAGVLRGFPLEETVTREYAGKTEIVARQELIELSEAPVDDALFTAPADYLPALPTSQGGVDMRKQDTLVNRLGLYWQSLEAWANYWLGTKPTPAWGHGYDD